LAKDPPVAKLFNSRYKLLIETIASFVLAVKAKLTLTSLFVAIHFAPFSP
jgi:hypothetical protein